jgi:hypothetical protein
MGVNTPSLYSKAGEYYVDVQHVSPCGSKNQTLEPLRDPRWTSL